MGRLTCRASDWGADAVLVLRMVCGQWCCIAAAAGEGCNCSSRQMTSVLSDTAVLVCRSPAPGVIDARTRRRGTLAGPRRVSGEHWNVLVSAYNANSWACESGRTARRSAKIGKRLQEERRRSEHVCRHRRGNRARRGRMASGRERSRARASRRKAVIAFGTRAHQLAIKPLHPRPDASSSVSASAVVCTQRASIVRKCSLRAPLRLQCPQCPQAATSARSSSSSLKRCVYAPTSVSDRKRHV